MINLLYIRAILISVLLLGSGINSVALAQSVGDSTTSPSEGNGSTNLDSLHNTLTARKKRLQELRQIILESGVSPTPELQQELEELTIDYQSLQNTFSQLATGGIEIVEVGTEDEEFDWRKEIILVTQPLLENLKGLTEKPRKIERLKTIINQREDETVEIDNALVNLDNNLLRYTAGPAHDSLTNLRQEWRQRQVENQQDLELSRFQLATLQGDNTPRVETIKKVIFDFLNGRGLTIGLAVLVSIILWLLTRGLLWLLLNKRKREEGRSRLVSHRLASYGYTFFTTILIIIGVMVVLYVRGDLLLLALAIVVFVSIALSLRTILPQFVSEARLLLNIGSIREGERVIYEGLPYEVRSINVHSYLRNPHLAGVIRLPLTQLKDMTSRPATSHEDWFPSDTGETLLMEDGSLVEVLSQTHEFIEVRSRRGTINYIPTRDFIALNFENLSRSGSFMVVSEFGVDYELQDICLNEIPTTFLHHLKATLAMSNFSQYVIDVRVDFSSAGASSLDYIIFVELHSDAAMSKLKVERVIQQTCVKVCNLKNWTIPFPQLTVHQGGESHDSRTDGSSPNLSVQATAS